MEVATVMPPACFCSSDMKMSDFAISAFVAKTVTDVKSRGRSDCKTAQLLASGVWLNRLLANERVANVTNDHKQKRVWADKLIRKVFTEAVFLTPIGTEVFLQPRESAPSGH